MGTIKDQLRNATFRGVPFLVKNSDIIFGQKTVIHEYPNSDRVEPQFLGLRAEQFSLEMIFTGSGDEYFTARNTLKTALEEDSEGVLVHPYQGEINCAVVGMPRLREGDFNSGVGRFIVDFIKVDKKIFPTETADNTGEIEVERDNVQTAIDNFIGNIFGITFSEAYKEAEKNLEAISKIYTTVTNSVSIAADQITNVKSIIANYDNNKLKFLSGEENIADGSIALYNSPTGTGQDTADQIRLWTEIFDDIPANPIFQITTAPRAEVLTNTDVINTSAKALTLANMYNFTPEIQFASIDEVDDYRAILETRYKELTEVDTSIPSSYLSITGLTDSDLAYRLSLLRAQTQKFLDGLEDTVGEVVTIENVQPTNLTGFVYSYFGNLDNYDQTKELNNIQDPTQISGTLQIII
jgi:prophage DNA circulation protein